MYLLGIDLGTSSIKAMILNGETGETLGSASYPEQEMEIQSPQVHWAEQNPEAWWEATKKAIQKVISKHSIDASRIQALGIAYQMHGLVLIDKDQQVLRPSIIWCDSRAVDIGNQAFQSIGEEVCLSHLLNSPGNFTASKLRWVKDNEPHIYEKIDKMLLPGDYLAMKFTGEVQSTLSGLSEGILWDFKNQGLAELLLNHYEIDTAFIPPLLPTFANQGTIKPEVAEEIGLPTGIQVSYRAGDQPNNALSLNVLEPGEVAATAGTSGVVYGVSDEIKYDPLSRVNSFAHVNHQVNQTRLGVLLCINGTGILNNWLNNNFVPNNLGYEEMNQLAAPIPIGSDGVCILPFGNGAERVFQNKEMGSHIAHLQFNRHRLGHIIRAAQEGIVFSFQYGLNIMRELGINPRVLRAGHTNMFLSPIFRQTLAGISGVQIELYNTDGAQGAARGAGIGANFFKSPTEAMLGLTKIHTIEPKLEDQEKYQAAYHDWLQTLEQWLNS